MKVTLLVPTINEIDGLRVIMPRVKREWVNEIIVCDGGSTDGTVEYARAQGWLVVPELRRGLRFAYQAALPHITGEVIITFSPDGNSIPELIPKLVEKMSEGYDMVIASRYLGRARSYDDDFLTGFGNWFFNRLVNLLFRAHYTDWIVIYRAFRKQVIHDLGLDRDSSYACVERVTCTGAAMETLMSIRAAKKKLKVAEIPGDEPIRIGGVRKLRVFRDGFHILVMILYEFVIWR